MLLGASEDRAPGRYLSLNEGDAGSLCDGELAAFEIDGVRIGSDEPNAATGAAVRRSSGVVLRLALKRPPSVSRMYSAVVKVAIPPMVDYGIRAE